MPEFTVLSFGLSGPEFKGQLPAERLGDPGLSPALCQRFRRELFDTSLHILGTVRVPGFPLMRLQWIALCKTAGIVLLRSGSIDPDVFSLLLNGLESEDELKLVRQHVAPLQHEWENIINHPRPLLVNGYYRLSRMKDSSVVTVLGAFANAYFAQFGTSGA